MTDREPENLPVTEAPNSPCCHLRNKGMYVYTDGNGADTDDDYDSTIYWCLTTMKGIGPDDEIVGGRECRNPSRSCHEPI
jgi:hypothetical protein